MDALNAALRRCQGQETRNHLLRQVLRGWVPGCLLAACAVALLRGLQLLPALWPLPLALLLLPPLILLIRQPPGRRPGRCAARLDQALQAEGLAMGLAAAPASDPAWHARLAPALATLRLPPLALPGLRRATLATLCLLACLVIPLPESLHSRPSIALPELVQPLQAEQDILAEEELLPEPEQQEMQQQIQALREQLQDGNLDGQTWLALDRLRERSDAQGSRAARLLAENIAGAQALAAQPQAQNLQALADALASAQKLSPGLLRSAQADPELAAFLQRLQQYAGQGAACQWPQDFDPQACQAAAKALQQKLAERRAALARLGKDGECAACLAGLKAGTGRVNRGPGHAPLDPNLGSESGAVGQAASLPPGATPNPDGSLTLSWQLRDPDDPEQQDLPAAQALQARQFQAGLADARAAQVAAPHRALSSRYFDAIRAAAQQESSAAEPEAAPAPATAFPEDLAIP